MEEFADLDLDTIEKRVRPYRLPPDGLQQPRNRNHPTRSSRTPRGAARAQMAPWDRFYADKKSYKDRHNLRREFAELMTDDVRADPKKWHPPLQRQLKDDNQAVDTSGMTIVLEVGAGVGNTTFPLLRANPALYFFASDCSTVAIDMLRASPEYFPSRVHAWVADMRDCDLDKVVAPGSVDFITCVWTLSAIEPETMPKVVAHFFDLLKPGGMVLFRDYAKGDMTQFRHANRQISDGFYERQDDTRVFYFSTESLRSIFSAFIEVENNYVQRQIVNHQEEKTMDRIWIQSKYRKPESTQTVHIE